MALPRSKLVVVSKKSTVPVGVPEPGKLALTVAVKVIGCPNDAGVPMIVAINKIDVPGANPMKVKQDLLQHGVVLEEFGGTVLSSEVSAKKGTNIDSLLDQILLQAEILDLKANPNRSATGAVAGIFTVFGVVPRL